MILGPFDGLDYQSDRSASLMACVMRDVDQHADAGGHCPAGRPVVAGWHEVLGQG